MQQTQDFKSINIRTVCDMVIEMLTTLTAINKTMMKYGIVDVYPEQPAGPGGHKTNQTAVELANRICQIANPTYFKELFHDKVGEISITALRATKHHFVPLIQQYKESVRSTDAITTAIGVLYCSHIEPSAAFLTNAFHAKLDSKQNQPKEEKTMPNTNPSNEDMDICTLIKLRAVCSTLKAISGFVDNSFVTHEAEYSRFAAVNDINWASRPFLPGQVTPGYIPMQQVAAAASFIQRPEGNNPFVGLVFSEAELDQVQTKLNEIANILFKGK